jgi:hypothetical protein
MDNIENKLSTMTKEDLAKLRRRVEDRLRKSPALLKKIIVYLVSLGEIEIE